MPITLIAPTGARFLVAGLLGLAVATPALADQGDVLVSQHLLDQRSIAVEYGDLDLTSAYDRDTLQIRINRAARAVCDIAGGSKHDRLPEARACFEKARDNAVDQLAASGVPASALAGG